jgi:hypothetical protein
MHHHAGFEVLKQQFMGTGIAVMRDIAVAGVKSWLAKAGR